MNDGNLKNIKQNSSYFEFIEIDLDAHHEKVRFFEENRDEIYQLDFNYKIFIWCDYAISVFELGRYQEFIKLADELIPTVIKENIYRIRDVDIYTALLFRKGASLYNINKLEEAEYIFSELCKIEKDIIHQKAWIQTMQRILKGNLRYLQAISVLLFILTAVIIAVELLVIRNFYPVFSQHFEMFRIGTFILGIAALVGLELYIRLKSAKMFKTRIK